MAPNYANLSWMIKSVIEDHAALGFEANTLVIPPGFDDEQTRAIAEVYGLEVEVWNDIKPDRCYLIKREADLIVGES